MVNEEKKKALKVMLNGVIDSFFEAYGDKENPVPQAGPFYNPMVQFHPASNYPTFPSSISIPPQMPTPRGLEGRAPGSFMLGGIEKICSGNISSSEEEGNKKTIARLKRIFEWGIENSLCEKYSNVSRGILILERIVDTGEKLYDEIDVFVKIDAGSSGIVVGSTHDGTLFTHPANAPIVLYSNNNLYMSYIIPIDNFDIDLVNRYCTRAKSVKNFVEKKRADYNEYCKMLLPPPFVQEKGHKDVEKLEEDDNVVE